LALVSLTTIIMVFLNLSRRYFRGLALHLALHLTKDEPFHPTRYWKNIILGGFFSRHHLFEMCIIVPHMPPFLAASFEYSTEVGSRSVQVTYELSSFFTLFVVLRMYAP
jgi:hypothetical protein